MSTKKNWVSYRNGNYKVYLNLDNGTKLRCLDDGEADFIPAFPEGCDILISTRCDRECPYCYAGCSSKGIQPPIPQLDFEPYTEVAINLNFPLHPGLEEFLEYQHSRNVIVNATINQEDLLLPGNITKLRYWQEKGWLKAIGVSYTRPIRSLERALMAISNPVLHVIEGIFSEADHEFLQFFRNKPKLLILGYKDKGRGLQYRRDYNTSYQQNSRWLLNNLGGILGLYPVVSFDNVAIEHLQVKKLLGPGKYSRFYMGDEGEFTFAIDLVKRAYSTSSQDAEMAYQPMGSLTPTEMFQEVRSRKENPCQTIHKSKAR